jgi:hypothetical protein
MRRPRKPVPPNTVTVRPFVATMIQIRQFLSWLLTVEVEGPIRSIKQPFTMMKYFNPAAGRLDDKV